jgi:hypothetical protein
MFTAHTEIVLASAAGIAENTRRWGRCGREVSMAYSISCRVLLTGFSIASAVVLQAAAHAGQCTRSCASGNLVCTVQARTAEKACLLGCGSDAAAAQCRHGCAQTFRTAQVACRAARGDCGTSCPALSAAAADTCSTPCSSNAQACFANGFSAGEACVQGCPAGTDLPDCLEQCAAGLRSSGAACLATLQGCLAECEGPVSGACFDTIALQCTTEACSSEQACSQPNEFCSPRCGSPPPSGTCFDPSTMQCTTQTCSPSQPCPAANQSCMPVCPPPTPTGKCFDTTTKQCTDQTCPPGSQCAAPNQICTLQCPPAQCSSLPCAGTCVVPSPCPLGATCPVVLGQCEASAAGGACECVPILPTPLPTPQCATCSGPCTVPLPCAANLPCPDLIVAGQCEASAAGGACECVPVEPTPPPTPTPQCTGATCAGPCIPAVSPLPCPATGVCNGPEVPVLAGQCEMSAAGACECVPVEPTPLPTPPPAECTSLPCAGSCTIFPTCTPGGGCPQYVILGTCQVVADTCTCVSSKGTPLPTPTFG